MTLPKKVCLLTGASGTLGTAFCQSYADKYHIAAIYRKRLPAVPSQLQRLVDPLDPSGTLPENEHPVFAIQADLHEERELSRVVELTLARFGQVDLLINAAVRSLWASMVEDDRLLESFEAQLHMNLKVPVRLAIHLMKTFWRDRVSENIVLGRNVINVSSLAGVEIFPNLGQSVYSATKAALNHMTRHMANEFRPLGIRVNALAPNSFPRIVSTARVADALVTLDEGDMSGKVMVIDRAGEHFK
jgi:NAD(P)-dependent dehydrogenase (short-subunit alcohol dehydrogenase family)